MENVLKNLIAGSFVCNCSALDVGTGYESEDCFTEIQRGR